MARYYVSAQTGRRVKKKPPAYCPHGVPAGSGRCSVGACWNSQPITEAELRKRARKATPVARAGRFMRMPLLKVIVDDAARAIEREQKRERVKARRRRTKEEQKRPKKAKAEQPKPLTGRAPRARDDEEV